MSRILFLLCVFVCALPVPVVWGGSIFLTGHDPDFHAFVGGNSTGAAHINQIAMERRRTGRRADRRLMRLRQICRPG